MTLMNLIRSLAAVALGWMLLALGIGAIGGGPPSQSESAPIPAEPSLHDAMPSDSSVSKRYELIDQASGSRTSLRLPEGDEWTIVSVCPWRDPSGELVAVGRWVNREDGPFCGLGVFRVSDSAVLGRVATEILPTGRPCWVPGHPWTVLFPAGDGRLHRCRLRAPTEESLAGPASEDLEPMSSAVPLTWKANPPGQGKVLLGDPIWPAEPRLRRFVIVALSLQVKAGPCSVFQPSRLWWLEMNEAADTILTAGPLTGPARDDSDGERVCEQYPGIAIGTGGEIHVIYLSRRGEESALRLHSARLGFDADSGRPRIESGRHGSRILGEGLDKAPLLVSADGGRIFALDRAGRIRTLSLAGKTPGDRTVVFPR
jgi:hypothetical protein